MPTYTQITYHIVFSTKNRAPALLPENRRELFRYIWGILKNKKSTLIRINGVADHLHILTSLHPTVALADLVREIKVSSSLWIRQKKLFPEFSGWQDSYAAFTCAMADRSRLINYIKNQEEHHRQKSFQEELREFLIREGVKFDERYFK
ncbi:MAG: IS200/IS605 family transposase [Planctomycetota bacterium]